MLKLLSVAILIDNFFIVSSTAQRRSMIDPSVSNQLQILLVRHEGLELKPYKDSSGNWSIGIGRNLSDVGISTNEAMMMLEHDILRIQLEVPKAFPWFNSLTPARQVVVLSMAFNLGIQKLREFKRMIQAIEEKDYARASQEMLSSDWAKQVKKRATELAVMMKLGTF